MQWEAREGTISLFVENLPERLHWIGLWFAFARHGEVVNVYIARKRSRGGKRFGFVRMKNLEEADHVTQRLNGAILYGSRLEIGFNDGTLYPLCNQRKKKEKSYEKSDESILTAIHGNGDEESNKKVCTLGHDEKLTAGNSVGTQRVISVEKVGQEITKADGSNNDSIRVSLTRSGPEILNFPLQNYEKGIGRVEVLFKNENFFSFRRTVKALQSASIKEGPLLMRSRYWIVRWQIGWRRTVMQERYAHSLVVR
ncbi:hypothetical protein V6N11_044231 [Hibiscus sabdariffa]|uniref:RRM domain-containing protein n=1 Tax=Hibiscus sabdariffa TaxID=183260 RepID=A0ABR2RF62_9ROSI